MPAGGVEGDFADELPAAWVAQPDFGDELGDGLAVVILADLDASVEVEAAKVVKADTEEVLPVQTGVVGLLENDRLPCLVDNGILGIELGDQCFNRIDIDRCRWVPIVPFALRPFPPGL